jgi:hypothetical protein
MSKIEVDTIEPQSGTSLTLGASGDTITVPSGATLDVTSATVSGITSYTNSDALTLFNASGSAPVYACRAWVNFDGTGTPAIREDGNVTSITDNGTGDYTVNFTTAMPDVNYSLVGTSTGGTSGQIINIRTASLASDTPTTMSTTAVRIRNRNDASTLVDPNVVCIGVFR